MTSSVAAWDDSGPVEPAVDWRRLGKVYLFGNGKGGVGKTTCSTHAAALVASDGARTLLVDLNGQGNVATILGFANTEANDQGRNLFSAITAGAPLTPVRDVRPNLDVVPGGMFVKRITPVLSAEMGNQHTAKQVLMSLALALQQISDSYGLIIIDSPPENQTLLQLALCAARFVVVPMKTDALSRTGLRELAGDFRAMREHNPYLILLGCFVFASGYGATNIRKETKENVSRDLGQKGDDVMLKSFIRHSEAVGQQVPKYGRLAHELEKEIVNNPKHWELKKGTAASSTVVSTTTQSVAEDFAKLTKEILTRGSKIRAEMMEKGMWP
ncbi:chromosome partitioning protein ParA [Mycobacterium vulneris]|uniref:ParA family protein n=1 Tax=Mycolicibacterium septicum DSM 44393 TaxID=1341646 RepID=A0A7X6MU57_9MYCO|nr:AAA family ATPase [Mycobacterium sp. 20091114027_K0903767]MCP3810757.1 ParA family protein [Mycobacteriaceae bacterium Msp059]NKZ14985.1 ParA family protein [Mycolicibacterium septicum DSM 44393]OBK04505.1 chromosome partitioning protein ParA [Mycolicibacterium fortuitum]OCB48642.1 chromosome partitioning protein ParA [Mycolicibacterium vulneris]